MQLNYFTYKTDDISCKHCGWQGKGKELKHRDFTESSFIADMECPNCHETIASGRPRLQKKWSNEKRNIRVGRMEVEINDALLLGAPGLNQGLRWIDSDIYSTPLHQHRLVHGLAHTRNETQRVSTEIQAKLRQW